MVGCGRQLPPGHTSSFSSVAFSPDGARVLSGSSDQTAKLWDAATGQLIRTFTGHVDLDWVGPVAFSPDGARVLAGSFRLGGGNNLWNVMVQLWDVATGRLIRTFAGSGAIVHSLAFSPDGARVLSGS